jgi:RNA polymerase sigma-70 factor (ECF subfamily)
MTRTDACGWAPVRAGPCEPFSPGRDTVRESDRELLPAVWDEFAPELARLACALGVDTARAEDVLQDVYLAAHQKQPRGADPSDLRRWLYRVTVNRCNLEHRRQTRRTRLLRLLGRGGKQPPQAENAEQVAGRQEERELVRRALDNLEPPLRSVLVLRYFTELDSKEIGRILGLSDSTVRSRLRTARSRLASALRRMGYDDDSSGM